MCLHISDDQHERRYRDWERRYTKAAESFAVCELLEALGSAASSDEISTIVDTHDQLTCLAAGHTLS